LPAPPQYSLNNDLTEPLHALTAPYQRLTSPIKAPEQRI